MEKIFEDEFGYRHNAVKEISSGGQGVVYRTQNQDIAVKIAFDGAKEWCRDTSRNRQYKEIRTLPLPEKIHLTLPQAVLRDYQGYVMTLLSDMVSFESAFERERPFTNAWLDSLEGSWPEEIITVFRSYLGSGGKRKRQEAYFEAACILASLHAAGLVYCDFSPGNVFISEKEGSGAVWLIDADNLNFQKNAGSVYTPGYGAPELYGGKSCTFYSDAWSFAVSFFRHLTGSHPLEGPAVEEPEDGFYDEALERAYAGEVPWILDSEDDANQSETQIPHELAMSEELLCLFDRTFSEAGRKKRQTRPTMFEWACVLAKEVDRSVKCGLCGMDYDASLPCCPCCDHKNRRILLTSRVCEKNAAEGGERTEKTLWTFAREAKEKERVSVPLRLVHGFRLRENGKYAFSVGVQEDCVVLGNLADGYAWSVCQAGKDSFRDIYGQVTVPFPCTLGCKSRAGEKEIRIEVSVE